jgi:two-component system OmpR family sensor kinase
LSIRARLTILYTFILTIILILFGVAVYLITASSLMDDVDLTLSDTAQQLRDQTKAFVLGSVAVLSVPEEELDVFQTATNFFVILDAGGELLTHSENLEDYAIVLDPSGMTAGENFGTVDHNGRNLRVLTEPLYIQQSGEQPTLIGFLQVARLVDNQTAVMDQLRIILILTGLAAVSLSLFIGALMTHHLLKPLDDIAAVAMQITNTDDLSRRLPDTGRRDEIGRLTMVLNQTLERLERLFHARQRFLADVSHELRTPLTTIRGNVDLMRRMGELETDTLDVVQDELQRMTRLVDDLLLLARADTGALPIQREPVELDNVFLDVCRQLQSIEQPVALTIMEVDQVTVIGDGDRLKQLVINLVDNAIKYTPSGGEVFLSLSKFDSVAEIVVRDNGLGIPPEDLPHIFDRFYRVDKARSRKMGGSGLGLSIARWIVEAHGGDIRVESKMGQGSAFIVTLPAITDPQEIERHERMIRAGTTQTALEPSR